MNDGWFCRMLGDEFGPYTFAELRAFAAQGQLAAADEVRDGSSGRWSRAADVPGLFAGPSGGPTRPEVAAGAASRPDEATRHDDYGFLAVLEDAEDAPPAPPRPASDDLLAGIEELEDAAADDFELTADVIASAAPPRTPASAPRPQAAPPAFAYAVPPASPPAGYGPPAGVAPASFPSRPQAPAAPHRPLVAATPPPAAAPAAPPTTRVPPDEKPSAPTPAAERPPTSEPSIPKIDPGATKSAAHDLIRNMAAERVRAGRDSTASTPSFPRPSFSKPASGGGGGLNVDLSNLKLNGPAGVGAALLAVVLFGWFGSGLLSSMGVGKAYDELVTFAEAYETAKSAGAGSSEAQAVVGRFKERYEAMMSDLGRPDPGSAAHEVKQAARAFNNVLAARGGVKEADMAAYELSFKQQLEQARQAVGR